MLCSVGSSYCVYILNLSTLGCPMAIVLFLMYCLALLLILRLFHKNLTIYHFDIYIRNCNCRSMKLSNLYNLFAACFEQVHCLLHSTRVRPRSSSDGDRKGQKRARCRSNSSLPCEAAHKTCYRSTAAAARVRSTLQKSAEQRLQKVPSNVAALINKNNAARFCHAAKRLSVAKILATRPSYLKAHAKRVKSLTMRANVESACVSVLNTGKSIPLNRFVDGICSNCLFSFYCDDKDKMCLSVNSVYYAKY